MYVCTHGLTCRCWGKSTSILDLYSPPPLPPRLYKQIPRVDGKEQVFDWFVQFALRSPCIRTEEEEEEEAKKALDVYSRSISRLFSQARMDLYAVKCCCWITKEAQTDDGQLFKKKKKNRAGPLACTRGAQSIGRREGVAEWRKH